MNKTILTITIALFTLILVALPVSAQAEKCTLGAVNIVNNVDVDGNAHSKTTFSFACQNSTKDFGQVTRIVYHVPLTDVGNFEASDSLGTMKVSEGPQYATATIGTRESTLGVNFRKPLLITDDSTAYSVIVEFDSNNELVSKLGNGTFSIKPGKQVSNPKTTIITTGVTETTYSIDKIKYELNIPTDSTINVSAAPGCVASNSRVTCQNISGAAFNDVEITWIKPQGLGGVIEQVKDKISGWMPTITNIFKQLKNKISRWLK